MTEQRIYRLSDEIEPERQDKNGAAIVAWIGLIVAVFLVLHLTK